MRHRAALMLAQWSPRGDRILTATESEIAIWGAPLDAQSVAAWQTIARRHDPDATAERASAPPEVTERSSPGLAVELSRAANLLASAVSVLPYQVRLAQAQAAEALDAYRAAHHLAEAASAHRVLAVIAASDGDLGAARQELAAGSPGERAPLVLALAQLAATELARPDLGVGLVERFPDDGADPIALAVVYLAAQRYADAARLAERAISCVQDRAEFVTLGAVAWAARCLASSGSESRRSDAWIAAYAQLPDGDAPGVALAAAARWIGLDRTGTAAIAAVPRVIAVLGAPKTAAALRELRRLATARCGDAAPATRR